MHIARAGAGPEVGWFTGLRIANPFIPPSARRMSSAGPMAHADAWGNAVALLISRWRLDAGGTYQTWFLWNERLKNFRSIRRGLAEVVSEIDASTFGTAYKGSSLE